MDTWPAIARRTAALARDLWRSAGVPPWDEVVATTWWRWVGHASRLCQREPSRWVARTTQWRNACWLRTVRFCNATATGATPVRQHRGHIYRPSPMDRPATNGCGRRDSDWVDLTAEREIWEALEPTFVHSVLRCRARPLPLPWHRHFVRSQPQAPGDDADRAGPR